MTIPRNIPCTHRPRFETTLATLQNLRPRLNPRRPQARGLLRRQSSKIRGLAISIDCGHPHAILQHRLQLSHDAEERFVLDVTSHECLLVVCSVFDAYFAEGEQVRHVFDDALLRGMIVLSPFTGVEIHGLDRSSEWKDMGLVRVAEKLPKPFL